MTGFISILPRLQLGRALSNDNQKEKEKRSTKSPAKGLLNHSYSQTSSFFFFSHIFSLPDCWSFCLRNISAKKKTCKYDLNSLAEVVEPVTSGRQQKASPHLVQMPSWQTPSRKVLEMTVPDSYLTGLSEPHSKQLIHICSLSLRWYVYILNLCPYIPKGKQTVLNYKSNTVHSVWFRPKRLPKCCFAF